MSAMLSAFRSRVLRQLPLWMGSAFLIAAFGMVVSALLNDRDLKLGKVLLVSVAFAFVWGAVDAPMTAHSLRKEERLPARSTIVLRLFVYSFVWSVLFFAAGLTFLGCSFTTAECLAASNLQIAFVVALVIGGVLSLLVLSARPWR